MAYCSIALGGNQGDPEASFKTVLQLLEAAGHSLIGVSGIYRTPAMGQIAGDDFLNAVAVVETQLPPGEMLTELHLLEKSLGRNRIQHWAPRTIDLDLLLYDQIIIDDSRITVPHPAMWYRRFVLEPLAEIARNWVHPVLGETIECLLQRLNTSPIKLQLFNVSESDLRKISRQLADDFDAGRFQLLNDGDDREDVFAKLRTTEHPKSHRHRIQPAHEPDRTIRRPMATTAHTLDELTDFLRDVLTAIQPKPV